MRVRDRLHDDVPVPPDNQSSSGSAVSSCELELKDVLFVKRLGAEFPRVLKMVLQWHFGGVEWIVVDVLTNLEFPCDREMVLQWRLELEGAILLVETSLVRVFLSLVVTLFTLRPG